MNGDDAAMRRLALWWALTAVAVSLPMKAAAATIFVGAAHDATIFENNPANASGGGNGLFAGTNGAGSRRRALLAFDLATVPAGATVQSAVVELTLGQFAGSGGGPGQGTLTSTISLHRIASPWGEGATQRQIPPTDTLAGVAQGAAAEANDVTWNSRFYGADPANEWDTPGGDFSPSLSSSLEIDRSIDASFTWPSNAAIVNDVQGWLADPATNFGWMLVNNDEASPTTFRAFYSRDVATATFHPKLTIVYTEPTAPNADFDEDADVDGADFLTLQRGLCTLADANRSIGDANGDGAVNALDLSVWKQQFSLRPPLGSAVPEPRAEACVWAIVAWSIRAATTRPTCRRSMTHALPAMNR